MQPETIVFITLLILAIISTTYSKKIFNYLKNNYKNKFKEIGLEKVSSFFFELNPMVRVKLINFSLKSLFSNELKIDKTLEKYIFMHRLFMLLFVLCFIVGAVILILSSQ